jgi:ectoine hydroxylase-related dioxygenase (phytanoyl-CoA dioxygenase family)
MFGRREKYTGKKEEYYSEFGGTWIDRCEPNFDFDNEIKKRGLNKIESELRNFRENGYVIFKNALSAELIEQINEQTVAFKNYPDRYVMRKNGQYYDPADIESLTDKHRIIDVYGVSEAARNAAMCEQITTFLSAIFEQPPIAIQSLSFQYGSEQALHQDTAYVVAPEPAKISASWIALEDISVGSGELLYLPKSHRFPDYKFSGISKSWKKSRDGQEDHKKYLSSLHELAKDRNLLPQPFVAKAGDILIWHSDLVHGGAPIKDKCLTRKSLVTHYVPLSVKPNYFNINQVKKHYYELPVNGGFFASRHYDLSEIQNNGAYDIYYDAKVTERKRK